MGALEELIQGIKILKNENMEKGLEKLIDELSCELFKWFDIYEDPKNKGQKTITGILREYLGQSHQSKENELRGALEELVKLKEIKDRHDAYIAPEELEEVEALWIDYLRRKPLAWAKAKQALQED